MRFDRRQFLKAGAAGATLAGLAGCAGMPGSSKARVVVVGGHYNHSLLGYLYPRHVAAVKSNQNPR